MCANHQLHKALHAEDDDHLNKYSVAERIEVWKHLGITTSFMNAYLADLPTILNDLQTVKGNYKEGFWLCRCRQVASFLHLT